MSHPGLVVDTDGSRGGDKVKGHGRPPFPQIDIFGAMIVWRVRRKIII